MKIRYIKTIFTILSVLLLSGCDKVEEPFFEGNPFTGVYASNLPIRKVLIEEYTGFKCPNCPRAAEQIHVLQESYGGHVVPIAIHAGYFATPGTSEDPDFITAEGTIIGETYMDIDVTPFPIGIINRTEFNDSYLVEHELWAKHLTDILKINKFADIGIEITPEFIDSDTTVNILVEATAIITIKSKIFLSIMIVESHIIGRQKDGSIYEDNYEHNHVLRGAVNGPWGHEIASTGIEAGNKITSSFSNYHLNSEWIPQNLSLIAIIYNGETKEVIQAEEVKLIN